MLQDIESDPIENEPLLETDAAPPAQPTKAASLTGSLVQRGRDRAPRIPQVPVPAHSFAVAAPAAAPEPAPAVEFAPVSDEVPLVFARPPRKAAPEARRESRWSEVLFVAACCAAFFATFLFVLRF